MARIKEDCHIVIKESMQLEDMMTVSIHTPNNRVKTMPSGAPLLAWWLRLRF